MGRKNNTKGFLIFAVILAVIVVMLAVVLLITLNKSSRLKNELGDQDQIQNAGSGQTAENSQIADVTIVHKSKSEEIGDYDTREIDFTALKSVNPDVCAWISIPGTNIDCAVVMDNDDPEYYLTNDISGLNGVFMQSYNRNDLSDRMSVIYGKKNSGGTSAFEELFKFQDSDFYNGHKYIYVYTENKVNKYRIFAAHRAVANHLMLGYDWDVDQIYLDYLISVLGSNELNDNIDKNVEITVDDKVLTLSERVTDDENVRFLVQGVLEK